MPKRNDAIIDRATFTQLTDADRLEGERHVAGLYFLWMTDDLAEIAHNYVSSLFRNSRLGKDLGGAGNLESFARFRYEYGHSSQYLDKNQRGEIYRPVFGEGLEQSRNNGCEFMALRGDLLDASFDYLQHSSGRGDFLRSRKLRSAHGALKSYLREAHGDVLKWSCHSICKMMHESVYQVFRSERVAAAHLISNVPGDDWPYCEDAAACRMVERLAQGNGYEADHRFKARNFEALRRAAITGAEVISFIISNDLDKDDELRSLAERCYAWQDSLENCAKQEAAGECQVLTSGKTKLLSPYPRVASERAAV